MSSALMLTGLRCAFQRTIALARNCALDEPGCLRRGDDDIGQAVLGPVFRLGRAELSSPAFALRTDDARVPDEQIEVGREVLRHKRLARREHDDVPFPIDMWSDARRPPRLPVATRARERLPLAIEHENVGEEVFIRAAGLASPVALQIRRLGLKHDEPSVRGDLRPRAAAIAALCQHRWHERGPIDQDQVGPPT